MTAPGSSGRAIGSSTSGAIGPQPPPGFVSAADEHDGARELVAGDRLLDERHNRRETSARFDRRGAILHRRTTGRCERRESQRDEGPLHGIQYILRRSYRFLTTFSGGLEHA